MRKKEMLTIAEIKKIAIPILKKNGVKKAGIFGSVARKEQRKESDIDILIQLDKRKSLLDFIAIKLELEKELERNVDLVEYDMIKPIIKDSILREEIKII